MASDLPVTTTIATKDNKKEEKMNDFDIKTGLARMLKGGVIMDVVNAEQVCRPLLSAMSHSIDVERRPS